MRGRQEEAEAAFREAVAHEHPDASSDLAAVEVARLLADRPGGEQEAEAVLREARDDPYFGPQAALVLGLLLAEQPGRESEAEGALRDATRNPYWGEQAAPYLTRLRRARE